jgi:anti-sigma-K factor RskA
MNDIDHNRWGEDLAAYMLGALEPGEADEFGRHLEGCRRCQAEVRWFEPALGTLAESAERREPPRQLREALLAEVRADARRSASAEPRRATRSPFSRWLLKPAVGFAVLALLIAGAVGYEVGSDGDGAGGPSTLERNIDGIGVKMIQEGGGGTLQLSNLPQLPADKVLEAWVEREGEVEAVPALLVPDRNGQAETTIADMSGVSTVMVTEEPQGGSEEPTSPAIVTMSVPQ